MAIRVTFWNEHRHEQVDKAVRQVYPEGLHAPIAESLRELGMSVRIATLDDPEHGLSDQVLAETDVLIWWGHMAHDQVQDEIVARVHDRVLKGMGLVALHSSHFSKIFTTM